MEAAGRNSVSRSLGSHMYEPDLHIDHVKLKARNFP
jgi:hypothetical protein